MASLLGLGGANAVRPIQYSGLNVSSSKMDMPVPIFWGMRRLTTNAIWYNNFKKHSVTKGGKGGGKSGQYDYTAAVIVALCEGTVDSIQNIWAQASTTTTTTLSNLNMTFFNGTAAQTPWSYVTTNYPAQARAYALTAYLACPKLDLGSAATIPDNQFECQRLMSFSYTHTTPGYINPTTLVQSNGIDVLLSDVIPDFLTNPQYGMGFSSGDIGDLTQFAAYQQAQGLFFSPAVDQQDKATSILDRWAELANTWIYWSGTQLQFVPLGDTSITGNGVTYTPTIDVSYSLGPADFVGDVPIKVSRVDPADAYNRTRLDITDRTLGYVSNPIEYKDQTLVDEFGLRDNAGVDGKDICDPIVGKIVVQLIGKRAAYIRNTYAFKATYRLLRCLPGTVLTLTEPNIGLNQVRVRVRTISEGQDNTLDFVCEEFPGTIATYAASDPSAGNVATTPNSYADPGPVNTPCIVEPSSAFTGGVAKLLITASGGANWGGAQVNLSFDGTTYTPIGNIIASAPQGVLTSGLANHADPDTVDTLAVNCAESLTVPQPVTNADADALRTLSMVCAQPSLVGGAYVMPSNGELLAFGAVATTGTYTANLTYLRRGQYGTAPSAHSTGDQFTVIDVLGSSGTTVSYDLPAQYVGVPLYVKFCSTNSFGLATEDISTVAEYQYTPIGTGFGGGAGGIPTVPTGLTATPGNGQNQIAWAANPSTDSVTAYTLYAAPGSGSAFGSAVAIFTGSATAFTHSGLGNSAPYTYFVLATNAVGSSTHTAGVSATTNVAGMGTVSSVATGTGLTGGPITGSGTVSLASIADGDVLANTSGGSAAPVPTALSAWLDHVLGSTRGDLIFRGATGWAALAAGTATNVLTSNGAGTDPSWNAAGGGGGSSLIVKSNGVTVDSAAVSENFAGVGSVVTTDGSHNVTILIVGTSLLVNGDTPGPAFIADASGQPIAVPLQ